MQIFFWDPAKKSAPHPAKSPVSAVHNDPDIQIWILIKLKSRFVGLSRCIDFLFYMISNYILIYCKINKL